MRSDRTTGFDRELRARALRGASAFLARSLTLSFGYMEKKMRVLDDTYRDTWDRRSDQLAVGGFKSYREYLESPVWKEIRARALSRPHFQACYLCGRRDGIELHHTSYKWICAGPKMR